MKFDRLKFLANVGGVLFIITMFISFYMGFMFRTYLTEDNIVKTINSGHQETITALADIRQSIEVFNDLMKK